MTFLNNIIEKKQQDIDNLYATKGLSLLESEARSKPFLNFKFEQTLNTNNLSLIAEVKKASPSKGIIRNNFNHLEIALEFECNGASALSVLTEPHFFLGSTIYLTDIAQSIDIPILRKDFIIDPIQIYESVMIGADAVLLIAALLSPNQLYDLYQLAREFGLSVLVEVHDQEEINKLKNISDYKLVGINNRNLKTFNTDLTTVPNLISVLRTAGFNGQIVAESGYQSSNDLKELTSFGASAVLIGEGVAIYPELMGFFGGLNEN